MYNSDGSIRENMYTVGITQLLKPIEVLIIYLD